MSASHTHVESWQGTYCVICGIKANRDTLLWEDGTRLFVSTFESDTIWCPSCGGTGRVAGTPDGVKRLEQWQMENK